MEQQRVASATTPPAGMHDSANTLRYRTSVEQQPPCRWQSVRYPATPYTVSSCRPIVAATGKSAATQV